MYKYQNEFFITLYKNDGPIDQDDPENTELAKTYLAPYTTETFQRENASYLAWMYACQCGGGVTPLYEGVRYEVKELASDSYTVTMIHFPNEMNYTGYSYSIFVKKVDGLWVLDQWVGSAHSDINDPSINITFEDIQEYRSSVEFVDTIDHQGSEWIIVRDEDGSLIAYDTHTSNYRFEIGSLYEEVS